VAFLGIPQQEGVSVGLILGLPESEKPAVLASRWTAL